MTVSLRGGPARRAAASHRPQTVGQPGVGEIELTGDALDLAGDGLTLIAYSAEPRSQAEDQLKLLAAWSATRHTPPPSPPGYHLPATNPADPRLPGAETAGPSRCWSDDFSAASAATPAVRRIRAVGQRSRGTCRPSRCRPPMIHRRRSSR